MDKNYIQQTQSNLIQLFQKSELILIQQGSLHHHILTLHLTHLQLMALIQQFLSLLHGKIIQMEREGIEVTFSEPINDKNLNSTMANFCFRVRGADDGL